MAAEVMEFRVCLCYNESNSNGLEYLRTEGIMRTLARLSVFAFAAAILAAAPVLAFNTARDATLWEIPRQGAPSQLTWESRRVEAPGVQALGAAAAPAALAAFAESYGGNWHYQVNTATGTFHHVYGSGINMSRPADSGQAAETLARDFISRNQELFGVGNEDLVAVNNASGPGKRSVIFQQTFGGLPVWGGRAHLVFTEAGRLFAFGSDVFPGVDISVSPGISEALALAIAKDDIGFVEGVDTVDRNELWVLPVEVGEGGLEYSLAYRFDLNMTDPFGIWATWVDAGTGEILWRENHIRFADFTGSVEGDVEWDGYCDGFTYDYPLRNMRISISGVGTCYSDANGDFSISGTAGSRTITAGLNGHWVTVDVYGGTNASHSGTITDGTPYLIDWNESNSLHSERDVFAYVNKEHDWLKDMDPDWTGVDYEMLATVERTDLYCPGNAWWDGSGINLCVESASYGNTGRMGDVVYHEYGHAVTDFLYGPSDPPSDMHEGNSDIIANYLTRESIMGLGYYLNNCTSGIRNSDNTMTWPCTGSGHTCGQVIAGFHWDAWQELLAVYSQEYADSVARYTWHYGRKLGLPQSQPDQVYWTFVADDNDGNLDNGTPHYPYFCTAASNHAFPCPEITAGVTIVHTPLDNTQNTTSPYEVVAEITSNAGSIVPSNCRVTYRIDGGSFVDATMEPTGNPDEYAADIPAQAACTDVEYYIYAEDDASNTATHPPTAPAVLHGFGVGYDDIFADDFEADQGWTAGLPGDDASTGMWDRCNPQETTAQPADDNTPGANYNAYITDCAAGSSQGSYDVDGGKTTLQSPVFDLSDQAAVRAIYYRWYSNDTGSEPGVDVWVVQVTDDAWATYAELENTNVSNRNWTRMEFSLGDYIDLTDQVQFRFIASDEDGGSIVEAGVDDFSLIGCSSQADTTAPSVTVVEPNGGELYVGGDDTPYPVEWTASDDVGVVATHILLSQDGGSTYPDTIATGSITSPYDWFVPVYYDSETCRVKVVCVDAASNEGSDESDADFEIKSLAGVESGELPATVVLMQNRPSPFGGSTLIEFGLPRTAEVSLAVFDVSGRRVATLAEGLHEAGYHQVTWTASGTDGAKVSPGVYFYRLVTGYSVLTRKMLVVQ
jgi:hypothetical protein